MMMKILFICTHNRCRSILAEAITRHVAGDKIIAASAGSQPAGEVHPLTLKHLAERGIATAGLKSQSWDELDSFAPDAVITVCDSAAGEACPLWLGSTLKVHWGLPDPSKLDGTEEERRRAFFAVMDTLEERVRHLGQLPLDDMSSAELEATLNAVATTNAKG
jgi:arsenate reductase